MGYRFNRIISLLKNNAVKASRTWMHAIKVRVPKMQTVVPRLTIIITSLLLSKYCVVIFKKVFP